MPDQFEVRHFYLLMKRKLLFFICMFFAFFNAQAQEPDVMVDEFGDTIKLKPRFYPTYRLGAFGMGMFSSSRVILTDYAGSRDSRIGYMPFNYGGSVRVDFRKWAIESGIGFSEKRAFLSTGNNEVDKQFLSFEAKATYMEIPVLVHFRLHRPDSKTVVSPFAGLSFNSMGNWSLSKVKQEASSSDSSPTYLGGTSSFTAKNIGGFSGSFIAGVGLVRKMKKGGTLGFDVSYQVDFLSMPRIDWTFAYNYAGGNSRTYTHYFRYANQSIRFRLSYYFLNFTTEKKPKPVVPPVIPVIPAAGDSVQAPPPSIEQPAQEIQPADSLKPERFYRIKS